MFFAVCVSWSLYPFGLFAQQKQAWESTAWLRLLHYQPSWFGFWKSSLNSSQFFLSKQGQADPSAEWNALAVTVASNDRELQQNLACQFPARIRLYEEWTHSRWPEPPCADFLQWKKRLSFHSLSMVYSTAYAGNPASVFGHNLLKINMQDPLTADDPESGLALLDYGVAFQAQTNPDDGPVGYVLNGLFGGYPGFFFLQPYYELVNAYAYAENRDLWEFEFTLDPREKDLFLEHLWELIHQASASYYFTHVNCSTMLLEVLDAIRPDWNLRQQNPGMVLPHHVMQEVASRTEGRRQNFWPSQRRIFERRWEGLSAQQREIFIQQIAAEPAMASLDDPLVMDALIDHINIVKSQKDAQQQEQLRAEETHILLARAHFPAGPSLAIRPREAHNNPLLAHGIHKFSVWAGEDANGQEMGLRLRYGLHDLLDRPDGFNPYYHINFLDASLKKVQNSRQPIYHLGVMDVMSLNPLRSVDPLPSWAASVAWGNVETSPQQNFVQARGSFGMSWELSRERSLVLLMPDAELYGRPQGLPQELQRFGLRLGWYQSWHSNWRQLIEIHPNRALAQSSPVRWDWSLEQRLNLSASRQLEWRLARRAELEAHFGAAQFF